MAHPTYTVDGTKVPSVTTVISRYDKKDALIYAANKVGREGLTLQEAWYSKALTIGSTVHSLIESGQDTIPDGRKFRAMGLPRDLWKATKTSFEAYLRWKDTVNLRVLMREVSMVSEVYGFGGTLDATAFGKDRVLLDYKTSSGLFLGHKVQLAAYSILWEENNPKLPITGGYHLLRIDKEDGSFEHWQQSDVSPERELFLAWLAAYRIEQAHGRRFK